MSRGHRSRRRRAYGRRQHEVRERPAEQQPRWWHDADGAAADDWAPADPGERGRGVADYRWGDQ
ncbi:MAG TPA: hypothetical protein VNW68_05620 [Candidatus Limnocylindria bacterium]|nr:hypothetical protein [Candidatus Limnocylindria bacterium]